MRSWRAPDPTLLEDTVEARCWLVDHGAKTPKQQPTRRPAFSSASFFFRNIYTSQVSGWLYSDIHNWPVVLQGVGLGTPAMVIHPHKTQYIGKRPFGGARSDLC